MTTTAASERTRGPVILCYDGSEESAEAIAYAASLLHGARALVVTVWKAIAEEALSTASKPPASDPAEVNAHNREGAAQLARLGAREASAAGLDAEPLAVEAVGRTWEAIERVAEEHKARLIVCGTGRAGVMSMLPGDLASALVDHASVPVLVVPSSEAAAERREELQERLGTRRRFDVGGRTRRPSAVG